MVKNSCNIKHKKIPQNAFIILGHAELLYSTAMVVPMYNYRKKKKVCKDMLSEQKRTSRKIIVRYYKMSINFLNLLKRCQQMIEGERERNRFQ